MVRTTIQDEIKDEYTRTMATTDLVISEYLRQQKPEKEEEESWKTAPAWHVPPTEEVTDIETSYQRKDKLDRGSTKSGRTPGAGCAKMPLHITAGCKTLPGRAYMGHHN